MPRSRDRARAALMRIGGIAASVVLVLWGAATLAFLAFRIIPGDAVDVLLGPQAQVSEAVKDGIRAELGWRPRHDNLREIVSQALTWERSLKTRNLV